MPDIHLSLEPGRFRGNRKISNLQRYNGWEFMSAKDANPYILEEQCPESEK